MTIIRPFRALRPNPEVACKVACVPYDVVNDAEVYEYIRENPLSFLRITRPEAELSAEDRTRPELVFKRARQNLKEFIDKDFLFSEPEPSVTFTGSLRTHITKPVSSRAVRSMSMRRA